MNKILLILGLKKVEIFFFNAKSEILAPLNYRTLHLKSERLEILMYKDHISICSGRKKIGKKDDLEMERSISFYLFTYDFFF